MRSAALAKAGGTAQQDHEASMHVPLGGKGKAAAVYDAKAPSVHDRIKKPSVKEYLYDAHGRADDGDAHNIINGKKYNPRRGGRIDPEHDGACHRSLRAPVFSVGRFAPLPFPHAFANPLPSSSTRERPTPRSGLTATAWHAS